MCEQPLDGQEAPEALPVQDIYLSVQEVYGASLPPLMHPRHPNAVAFSTGPFIVIWDWKADRKQARTLSTSCVVCKLSMHSSQVKSIIEYHPGFLLSV